MKLESFPESRPLPPGLATNGSAATAGRGRRKVGSAAGGDRPLTWLRRPAQAWATSWLAAGRSILALILWLGPVCLTARSASLSPLATTEIAFIDEGIQDYRALATALRPGIEVVILDRAQDGVQRMARSLAGRRNLRAIHLFGHGGVAQISVGATWLHERNLDQYRAELQVIGGALRPGGDLLVFGCFVGQGEDGRGFLARLAQATGATVSGSTRATGAPEKGGSWQLDVSSGTPTITNPFTAGVAGGFGGLLPLTELAARDPVGPAVRPGDCSPRTAPASHGARPSGGSENSEPFPALIAFPARPSRPVCIP